MSKKDQNAVQESVAVEQKTVESIMEQLAKNAGGGKSGKRIKKRVYDVQVGDMTHNFAPQALKIIAVLLGMVTDEAGEVTGGLVREAEIAATLEENEELFKGSVQTPWKLYQYYRKALKDTGFLTEVASEEPTEEEIDAEEAEAAE